MTAQNIAFVMASLQNKLTQEDAARLTHELQDVDDRHMPLLLTPQWKNPVVATVLAFFLGVYGIEAFYTKHYSVACAKWALLLLLLGSFFSDAGSNSALIEVFVVAVVIGWQVLYWASIFLSGKWAKQYNYQQLTALLHTLE